MPFSRGRALTRMHHSHTLKISRQPFRVPLLSTKSTSGLREAVRQRCKSAGTPETKVYFLPNQTQAVLFAPDTVIAKKIPEFSSELARKGSD